MLKAGSGKWPDYMSIFNKDIMPQRAGSSGEKELTSLFDAYFDRLSYFAFKLVKDRDLADDMAQEAFITYWQTRELVDGNPVSIRNFLYTTVRNACLNSIRHEKVVSTYASGLPGEPVSEATIMDTIITAEVLDSLLTAVRSLPEPYQKISRLAYLEGKKNQEIADELGMSVNTVKKQKQKALEILRTRLRPELMVLLIFLGDYVSC